MYNGTMVSSLHISLITGCAVILSACYTGTSSAPPVGRQPGQGVYVYPQYQRPLPTQYVPATDICRAQLYQGLRGQHFGGIHIASIYGDKRIIKPAELETDEDEFLADMNAQPPLVEVTEMIAGQPLYAASVRTGVYRGQLGPDRDDRLTIELDNEGYVADIACR